MKDWNIKTETAQNAIYLKEDNGGKGRFFRARFLQPGLVKYSFGVCLLTKETIDKFVYKFVGCPVVIDHKDVSDKNAKDIRVGVISKVDFEQFDGWYWCEGVIFDQEAIDLVNNGYNVSCQYEITQYATNEKKELHNGNEYDKEILDGAPEHLAIVKNPRYESAMIAVNAIDLTACNEEKWITIKPHGEDSEDYRKLKLEDGESPKEAIDRVYKKEDKSNKDKEDAKKAEKQDKEEEWENKYKGPKEQRILYNTKINELSKAYLDNDKEKIDYLRAFTSMIEKRRDNDYIKNQKEILEQIKKQDKDLFNTPTIKGNIDALKELEKFNTSSQKSEKKEDAKKKATKLKDNESKEDFVKRILSTEITKYKPTTDVIDWGKQKQQGKRSGGMVMGSMGDITLQGKKEYKNILGGLPEYKEIKDEFNGAGIDTPMMQMAYLKAREAGFDKEDSMLFAYTITDKENLLYDKLKDDTLNKASNSFIEQFKGTLYTVLAEGIANRLGELIASNEERWITVHPHGDDSEDYRRLKLQDGESPKDAIDRVFKKDDKGKDKKEKSEAELKAEKKQLYQDILKAKKEGRKEDHHKMLERYREIERLLNGEEKNKKNEDKQTENKPQEKSKHFEKYNKIADEANKLKKIWQDKGEEQRKLIDNNAEYQRLEKEEEKLKDERSKLNYSTDKARWHQLSQEINDIYGLKENIRKDISSKIGIREAQEAYINKSVELTNEKGEVIKNSSEKIAERLRDNTKTDKILKELSSLSKEEYLNYKNQEIEYRKQYDALSEKLVKYSYGTPEYDSARKEKSEMYDKYLKAKGSASKIHYDFAVKVGKILQVKNGVKLSTEVSSSKMNDVVEKLHNCFDGVVPSTVFNNTTMNVRANSGRAYQQGQSIHISSNEKMGTAIHETMHHIEENSAEVLINSLSFAKYRTGDEKQRSLKNLTGLSYKANEVCKPDKFFNPYCGKLYNFGGGRNQTFEKGTASEIMSMGVQRIFEDPLNFAKDDREYFNFVLMNLRGELWD